MAKKISDLTLATAVSGADAFEVSQGGVSKRLRADGSWTLGALTVIGAVSLQAAVALTTLAADRVVHTTTGGALAASANLAFNGTTLTAHTLTVSTGNLTVSAGQYLGPLGAAATPVYASAAEATGMWFGSSNRIHFSLTGSDSFGITSGGTRLPSTFSCGWSSTGDPFATADLLLFRDAANTLAQRNGTNAQEFRVYNTFTDASNYERVVLQTFGAASIHFLTEQAGTGVARSLRVGTSGSASLLLRASGTDRFEINSSGHLLAVADNTYDIGASGATRPRSLFLGTNITTGAPSGGTAAAWKLGTVAVASPTAQNRTIEVEVGGTTYYVTAKTTND